MEYNPVISMCARVRTREKSHQKKFNKNEKKKPKISPNNPIFASFDIKSCKNSGTCQKDAKFNIIISKMILKYQNLQRNSLLSIREILKNLKKLILALFYAYSAFRLSPPSLKVRAHVRTSLSHCYITLL